MWLLSARFYHLEYIISDDVGPSYAVLSHTRKRDQVTYKIRAA